MKKILIILFLLALFLNVFGIWWGLPNYYNWALDDKTPTVPLLIAKNKLQINLNHPIFHYVLSDVFYAPYLGYLYLTGGLINPHQGFPYGFTDPLTSLTVLILISRLMSAVMGALVVVFIYLTAKTLYGKKAALFSALSVAFSYIFITYSHLGNLNIPYIFWFSIALYFYARLIKTFKTKYYIYLGIFTALSLATKDCVIGFFAFLPIPFLYLHIKHHLKNGLKSSIFNKKLAYCLIALFYTYIIFSNMLINFSGFLYRINLYLFTNVHEKFAHFPNTFLGQIQLFQDVLFNLKYSVGIALFLLFLIAFIYCLYKFNKYTFAFLLPLISYYLLNIARINYIRPRMTIVIIIILSLFSGRFLSDLIKEIKYKKFIYAIIILIFGYTLIYGFSADLTFVYDSRYSAEDWMVENIPKDAQIELYQDMQLLPRFHAIGFNNITRIFFQWDEEESPKEMLFKPIIDSPDLESLRKRNPDYIFIGCIEVERIYIENSKINPEFENYINLLLSEEAGYKIVKTFANKIPFAYGNHDIKNVRYPTKMNQLCSVKNKINKPVIILKKE